MASFLFSFKSCGFWMREHDSLISHSDSVMLSLHTLPIALKSPLLALRFLLLLLSLHSLRYTVVCTDFLHSSFSPFLYTQAASARSSNVCSQILCQLNCPSERKHAVWAEAEQMWAQAGATWVRGKALQVANVKSMSPALKLKDHEWRQEKKPHM